MSTNKCFKCGETKPSTDFYDCNKTRCKPCYNKVNVERNKKNRAVDVESARCIKCKQHKEPSEFFVSNKNGLLGTSCKSCVRHKPVTCPRCSSGNYQYDNEIIDKLTEWCRDQNKDQLIHLKFILNNFKLS